MTKLYYNASSKDIINRHYDCFNNNDIKALESYVISPNYDDSKTFEEIIMSMSTYLSNQICTSRISSVYVYNRIGSDAHYRMTIYKALDEWYYINNKGFSFYKCDQIEGLLQFLDDWYDPADLIEDINRVQLGPLKIHN